MHRIALVKVLLECDSMAQRVRWELILIDTSFYGKLLKRVMTHSVINIACKMKAIKSHRGQAIYGIFSALVAWSWKCGPLTKTLGSP